MFEAPNQYRIRTHPTMKSTDEDGNNGAFDIPSEIRQGASLVVVASDGEGWEHVSVSMHNRTPLWAEMCQVKDLFWGEDDVIVQFHPKKSQYVNYHAFCLHMWRAMVDGDPAYIPIPDSILVGPKKGQKVRLDPKGGFKVEG